jgi:hypothetical protein
MLRQHLQLSFKTVLRQVLLAEGNGPKRRAGLSRDSKSRARKNSREIVKKRDRTAEKGRMSTYKRHVLINKHRL